MAKTPSTGSLPASRGTRRRHAEALPVAPLAERDLAEIADYYALEKKNPSAARRVLQAIRDTCRHAGAAPQTGRDRSDLGVDVRSKVVLAYSYLIYFRSAPVTSGASVQVIRILHQRRDVEIAFTEAFPPR